MVVVHSLFQTPPLAFVQVVGHLVCASALFQIGPALTSQVLPTTGSATVSCQTGLAYLTKGTRWPLTTVPCSTSWNGLMWMWNGCASTLLFWTNQVSVVPSFVEMLAQSGLYCWSLISNFVVGSPGPPVIWKLRF